MTLDEYLAAENDAEEVIADDRAIPSLVLPGLATTVNDLWQDLDYDDPDGEDESEAIGPTT